MGKKYIDDLVSIITPVYNAERFIKETIKSVQSQTYKNWEMILIDDCSTDSSEKIIKEYMRVDNRIRYIKLEENIGVSSARNKAIEKSKGRYIAFLDSDDIWKSNKLKEQIDFMIKTKYYFTFTSYDIIDEFGNIMLDEVKCRKVLNYKKALKGNSIACLTVIIDRNYINNILFKNVKHEDYLLWLNILKQGVISYGLQKNLSSYRKVTNSLSSNKIKSAMWTWDIYNKHLGFNKLISLYYFLSYFINIVRKYFLNKFL